MTPEDVTLSRRRAELRGREAVARWRIQSAVWGGRLFAALFAVVSIFPVVYSGVSRWRSAALLFAAVVGAKLRSFLYAHEGLGYGAVWIVILLAATANGVWGAFALAAARHEAERLRPPSSGL